MIQIIYGAKGSGKTKQIIDATNSAADSATGQVIFVADNSQSLGISPKVRFVNLCEFDVKSEDEFIGFLKGMLATNFDIQKVFIDGVSRLLGMGPDELKPVFDTMAKVDSGVDFVVTVSADKLPDYLAEYAVKA